MKPARVRAHDFGHCGGECDDVVFDFSFNLKDTVHAEVGARVNSLGSFFGHDAGGGERLSRGDFNRQPGAEAVLIAPDASHLGAGVAWDHGALSPEGELGILNPERLKSTFCPTEQLRGRVYPVSERQSQSKADLAWRVGQFER